MKSGKWWLARHKHSTSLSLSLSLSSSLSLSHAIFLCLSCSALVLATNLLTDVNFYQRRLSMLPDTCPSERSQYTHILSHPCTHWDTHIGSLLTWNICGVLWSRFAFNYAPGHGRAWPSLVPNGDRDWASCQSPLTLTCMLLGLFNSDCETVPSIAIHPPGSASFDWIGIISKIYVTDSPGRTSSHVAHFWLMMCPALINAHSLPFLPPHVTPHAPSLRHALPCVMSCHVYGVI